VVPTTFSKSHSTEIKDPAIESLQTLADEIIGVKAVDTARTLIDPVLRVVRNPGWSDPLEL